MEFYRYTYVEIVKLISLYSLFNSGSLICVRSTLTCNALGSLDVIKKEWQLWSSVFQQQKLIKIKNQEYYH